MERTRGIAEAVSAVRRGELIVLPTDTVYGLGADAFTATAVAALLEAKGRGRDMPPPVLVGSVRAATALVDDLGTYGQDLIDEFWPGALTLVCRANPNLLWDLGETKGTVAVRMPMHELAVELLKETGPLAVSSANVSGQAAARTAEEAEKMLGDAVSVYLDAGESGRAEPSTILDLTGPIPRLLRAGAVPEHKIRAVVGVLLTDEFEDGGPDADAAGSDGPSSIDLGKPSLSKGGTSAAPDAASEAASGATESGDTPADSAPADAAPGEKPSLTKDEPPSPGGESSRGEEPPAAENGSPSPGGDGAPVSGGGESEPKKA